MKNNAITKNIFYKLFIFLIGIFFIFIFQNCGKVSVETTPLNKTSKLQFLKAETDICLPSHYTLESFFATNLNTLISTDGLVIDNDADGLADSSELLLGSDPLKRRTGGLVLDSVCRIGDNISNCQNLNFDCNNLENSLGINECDLKTVQSNHQNKLGSGLDTDFDGIPDYLEFRINSFSQISDTFNDLDFDQINTFEEALQGTSVRVHNRLLRSDFEIITTQTRLDKESCPGENWQFKILRIALLRGTSFQDDLSNLDPLFNDRFSKTSNQNIIQFFYKIRPLIPGALKAKAYTTYKKVDLFNEDNSNKESDTEKSDDNKIIVPLLLNQNDFKFVGDIEP